MDKKLEEIQDIESEISILWAKKVRLQHEYLFTKGWKIIPIDDLTNTYEKGGYICIDIDHALEHEEELTE